MKMINYGYIGEILGRFEGKAIARGYIPCDMGTWYGGDSPDKGKPQGFSGVTVGTGVDLGQQSVERLLSKGVSQEIVDILKPYIGLRQDDALEKLRAEPFQLTPEQVAELDSKMKKSYTDDAAERFGQDLFIAAPKQAQAVAVSLCYQFGSPYREVSPSLGLAWEAMKVRDYKGAAGHLSNPGGWSSAHQAYMRRRREEASLLLEIQEGANE